ncbi:MAG: hypothetical protein BEN19_02970 [Epulopiscium sp. Nuni2H_MBin003]|nr:MAG: hypothetical protein BEN19_02970 [Epulopiscium sp. Nuni2H_MBin003]
MEGQSQVKNFSIFEYIFGKKVVQKETTTVNSNKENKTLTDISKDIEVLNYNVKSASEIMTPRTKIMALDIAMSRAEITNIILEAPFSRLPVYEEDIHKIIGILDVQNFLKKSYNNSTYDIKEVITTPYIVPETKNIKKLLKELQSNKNQMAIIRDEYGDFSGIVTVEDILKEIVGDIGTHTSLIPNDDGSYIVDGLLHIDQLNKKLDLDIVCEHYDTIGGFIIHLLGEIPKEAVEVTYKNWVFEIKAIKRNRVEKLRIYKQLA